MKFLFQILGEYCFSLLYQQYIRGMYQNVTTSVQINIHATSKVPINCSVRQGFPLSVLLFALCIELFVRALADILPDISFGSHGTHPALLAYADDITIMLSPQETYLRYKTFCTSMELHLERR
jgi:hypothetical protein